MDRKTFKKIIKSFIVMLKTTINGKNKKTTIKNKKEIDDGHHKN